jgi:hypothetical protein
MVDEHLILRVGEKFVGYTTRRRQDGGWVFEWRTADGFLFAEGYTPREDDPKVARAMLDTLAEAKAWRK